MKKITISPQDYADMDRNAKRLMERSLKKQGLEMPKIPARIIINESVDKELFIRTSEILEQNSMSMGMFLDMAMAELIKTQR